MRTETPLRVFVRPLCAFCCALCALICAALPAQAAALYVAPNGSDNNSGTAAAPFATIQAAVNNAKSGDTVTLRAGTYAGGGNRDIDVSKAITIKSDSGAGQMTIDCGGSEKENHRGFFIHGSAGGVRIEGVTVENGVPNSGQTLTYPENQGAGALIERGSRAAFVGCVFSHDAGSIHSGGAIQSSGRLTLTGCTFDSNSSSGLRNFGTATVTGCKFQNNTSDVGAGIMNAGILTLTGSTFTDNTCEGSSGAGGGLFVKIDLFGGIRATVSGCTFTGNQAQDGGAVHGFLVNLTDCIFSDNTAVGDGGGLNLLPNGRSAVTRCVFRSNKAGRGGGIIALQFSHLALTSCVFLGNSAENGSGGAVSSTNELTARFCSFSGNTAAGPNAQGGAIANGGKASLTNCILWGDAADSGGEIGQYAGDSPSLSTSHCDIQGGYSGPGNQRSDPRFVSQTDLHLQAGSPCRHAGSVISGITTDAARKPRPTPPSIGAYE